jgi:hypothetical protein
MRFTKSAAGDATRELVERVGVPQNTKELEQSPFLAWFKTTMNRVTVSGEVPEAVAWWFGRVGKHLTTHDEDRMQEILDEVFATRGSIDEVTVACNVLLDTKQIQERTKVLMAVIAAERGAHDILRRLVGEGFDINQIVPKATWNNNSNNWSRWGSETESSSIGAFARRGETVKMLGDIGFDWHRMNESTGKTALQTLEETATGRFKTPEERDRVFKCLQVIKKDKGTTLTESERTGLFFTALKSVRKSVDLAAVLSGMKWEMLRDENGNNALHVLAGSEYQRGVYSLLKSGKPLELWAEKNKEGLSPVDILLSDGKFYIGNNFHDGLVQSMKKHGLVAEINMIGALKRAVENVNKEERGYTYSFEGCSAYLLKSSALRGGDALEKHVRMQTANDAIAQLKTTEGGDLLEGLLSLMKNGRTTLQLLKATATKENPMGFIETAKTRLELEVAVMSVMSWAKTFNSYQSNEETDVRKIFAKAGGEGRITRLMEDAMRVGVPVAELKAIAEDRGSRYSGLSAEEIKRFIPCWTDIEEMQEKWNLRRMMDAGLSAGSEVAGQTHVKAKIL